MEISRKYGISRDTIKKYRNSLSLYGSVTAPITGLSGTRYNRLNAKKEFFLKALAN